LGGWENGRKGGTELLYTISMIVNLQSIKYKSEKERKKERKRKKKERKVKFYTRNVLPACLHG